jgi:threonine dehydrogenase-like Zn-dependent dehydrogenase
VQPSGSASQDQRACWSGLPAPPFHSSGFVAGSTLPPVGTIASAREQLAMRTNASSVLVIGSGTSGQRAAIAVHQAGADVLMIAKRPRRLYPPQDIGRPEHVHSASAPTGSPPANQVLHP